jgi:hypothetical protein
MKTSYYFRIILFLLVLSFSGFSQQCPPSGSGKNDKEKHLNILKNHSSRVPSKAAQVLPLNMLITRSHKPDRDKFQEGAYVVVEGYIIDFAEEGKESCNCNKGSKTLKTGDVHIALALRANASKQNCIVVEITPSFKKLHPNYSEYLVRGARVKVYGYLVYDFLHESNAATTCSSCTNVWRKTCWEVHPITKIEIM